MTKLSEIDLTERQIVLIEQIFSKLHEIKELLSECDKEDIKVINA